MTNRKFSKIILYPVVFDKTTDGSYVLDSSGNKVIIKNYPYVFSSDSYNIIQKRYEYVSRPSVYITTANILNTINEGITVEYNLYALNADDGDEFKIKLLGNISTNDVELVPNDGIITILNKKASFTVKFNSNDIIENDKLLYLQVTNINETFTYLNYGPIVLKNNDFAPTYNLSGSLFLYEDEINTYTLNTEYVNSGTQLSIRIINASTNFSTNDYVLSTKQLIINNNSASFTISGIEDRITEQTETFYIQILDIQQNVVAVFGPIQVIDTSQELNVNSNYILNNFFGTSVLTESAIQNTFKFKFGNNIVVNSQINFSFLLSYINEIRQNFNLTTLNTTNNQLTGYQLIAFLCSDIDTNNNFSIINQATYSLNSAYQNASDQYSVSLSDNFSVYTNDYLLENMSREEIQKLYKKFKIVFRVCPKADVQDYENIHKLVDGDIVQDINIFLDTTQQGPYEVDFDLLDMVDPEIFTLEQRKQIYTNHISLLGYEGIRLHYPKNINELQNVPIIFMCHGMGQYPENYGIYCSMLASYGYCVASVWIEQEMDTSTNNDLKRGLWLLQIIDHLQKNIVQINNKYQNINFNNIILFGHSRGAGTCMAAYDFLYQKQHAPSLPFTNKDIIQNLNTNLQLSDIKAFISFACEKSFYLLPNLETTITQQYGGQLNEMFNLTIYNIDDYYLLAYPYMSKYNLPWISVMPTIDGDTEIQESFFYKSANKESPNIPKQVIFVKNASHDYIGSNYFTSRGGETDFPSLGSNEYDANLKHHHEIFIGYKTENFKSYNSTAYSLGLICEKLLIFISSCLYDNNTNTKQILKSIFSESISNKSLILDDYINNTQNAVYYIVDDFTTTKNNLLINSTAHLRGPMMDKTLLNTILQEVNTSTNEYDPYIMNLLLAGGAFNIVEPIDFWRLGFLTYYDNPIATLPAIDEFNAVTFGNNYGISYYYNEAQGSNFKLEYDFSDTNNLNIEGKSFICVNGGQSCNFADNNQTDSINIHFTLELQDIHQNTSSINSSQYSVGFIDNTFTLYNTGQAILTNIKFRIEDFKFNNANLDLSKIAKIILRFGSQYGSTSEGRVVIDEITILN